MPDGPIDVGNAGTLMRLLPGWLAAQDGRSYTLDGDASIRRRPVDRIAEPLRLMGVRIEATEGRLPPFTITGTRPRPIHYELPMASAQVKSCVLLAALAADGATTVSEPALSRDYTERMLAAAGVSVHRNGRHVTVAGTDGRHPRRTRACPATRRAPPSPSRPACSCPGPGSCCAASASTGRGRASCGSRSAWAPSSSATSRTSPGDEVATAEPITDLDVTAGPLVGTTVEADEVPLAIDELPLVALMGCFAEGETIVCGAQELRLKETDRIAAVVDGLSALGATIEATEDGFAVHGSAACAAGASPPTATTAWRCSAPSPASPLARASRSRAWRPPRSPTRASWTTWLG